MAIIDLRRVGKAFDTLKVVDDLTLKIEPGECVALLGHNGAGKTTLLKIILGLIRPDCGEITVMGESPGSAGIRRRIGFLPENVAFQPLLTGRETLAMLGRLKDCDPGSIGPLLARVELSDAADRLVGTYSKGMRQRLGLAQALLGQPDLFLLDEPTTGLDPMLRQSFFEIIAELRDRGAAILLSSHVLTELEQRTDRVAIMRDGKLVVDDQLANLRARAGLPVRIRLRSNAADTIVARMGGERMNGRAVQLVCDQVDKLTVLRKLVDLPVEIDDLELLAPSLDEIYAHFGKRETPS